MKVVLGIAIGTALGWLALCACLLVFFEAGTTAGYSECQKDYGDADMDMTPRAEVHG